MGPPLGPGPLGDRVLVIGDVAGHLGALRSMLSAYGIDSERATIPEGLVVVQAGDLVHRGPDSAGVIALVDAFLRGPDADRWIQLIGNHEALYLFDRSSVIRRELDEDGVRKLRAWWAEGLARIAVAVTPDWDRVSLPRRMRAVQPAGDVLVTHAGLTHGAWLDLGGPANAGQTAAALSVDAHGPATITLREGTMTCGTTDLSAGPLWAQAGAELLTSWDQTTDAPHLNQIHGHTTVRSWSQERWWPGAAGIVNRGDLIADQDTKREVARIGRRLIWGIDPGHDVTPMAKWQPLVIPLQGTHRTASGAPSARHRWGWHLPARHPRGLPE